MAATTQTLTVKPAPLLVDYSLIIKNDKGEFLIDPQDGVTLDRSPDLAPAKLKFKVFKDEVLDFEEGNQVTFAVNGEVIFVGYVFEKSRSKSRFIEVLCYDQLRYLKSYGCYVFDNTKTASERIKALCDDFGIKVGDIVDTKVKIDHVFDNKTVQDIIQTLLMKSTIASPVNDKTKHKPIYVVYDDKGLLYIKEMDDMITEVLIDETQVEDYEYVSSIDKNTYTQLLVVREAPVKGKNKKELLRTGGAYCNDNIKRWGVLQKVYKPDEKDVNAIDKAKKMLESLSKKTHTLRLRGVLGDTSLRPGSGIYVNFNLGDQLLNELVYVNAVEHTFKNHEHRMDLELIYFDKQQPKIETKDYGDAEVRKRIEEYNKSKHKSSKSSPSASKTSNATNSQVQAGMSAIEGTSYPVDPSNGCVNRALAGASYYNADCADLYNQGIDNVDDMETGLNAKGYVSEAYTGQANAGDILVYGDNQHVVIADGNGGFVGNSTSRGYVIQGNDVNYAFRNGVAPVKIIRTGVK